MMRMKLAIAIALALVEITSCLEIAQTQLSLSLYQFPFELLHIQIPPTPLKKGGERLYLLQLLGKTVLQVVSEQQKPPVEGRPRRRGAAGTRGPCEETAMPFTPLLPETDAEYSGLTLKEHPTFWFYVPYKSSSVSSGEFAIADVEGDQLYRDDFQLPETPGFVSVSIPPTKQPLEKNKQYRWTFVLHCTDQTSDQPIPHRGLVKRVDLPSIEAQLQTASLEKQLNLYLENRIWYDASADLAQIHNIPQAWLKLLRAMGLAELKQEAIAGSVVPIKQ